MKKLKVLIVEDVASMRKFVRFGLEKSFRAISIDEAATGKEAQAKLEHSEFDLVLCDWELPDINGDEILSWVRSHPAINGTPFIMVTSRNDKESVMKAIDMGVNAYIVKPFTAENLAQRITTVIEKFERREFERLETSGPIDLHFRDLSAKGNLIDLSLGGCFSVFSRKNRLPDIFDQVSIGMNPSGDLKIGGIEGFVIRIQAAEAFIDAENVKIAIKFLDMTPEKKGELSKAINALKSQNK